VHSTLRMLALVAFTVPTAAVPAFAAPPTDACTLLTAASVSSALGSPVANGTSTPGYTDTCTWNIQSGGAVTLHFQTIAFFNAGKGALASSERTSASGIGDDAYYLVGGLAVRKGSTAFKLSVYSRDLSADQLKAVEKNLAQQVLSKL
jgi:hypothetical protein